MIVDLTALILLISMARAQDISNSIYVCPRKCICGVDGEVIDKNCIFYSNISYIIVFSFGYKIRNQLFYLILSEMCINYCRLK